jgi:diaminohydroxyphosphoribosylaminopyrimidine deaminase/5-amino-6-(5-phosphoribosylamino)uracil reductase
MTRSTKARVKSRVGSGARSPAPIPARTPLDATEFSTADHRWMGRALDLAQKGRGTTRPNPIVGAVLVRNGRLLAEGYHQRAGLPHAEREALAAIQSATHPRGGWAGGDPPRGIARGATLYVTLEPCCHTGRTPPCTDALIASGVERVVVGLQDPNPVVNGQGIARLRRAGIRVDVGCRGAEAQAQNRPFLTWVEHGRPWVTLKVAATLDGFIADWSMPTTRETSPGPVWLTGEEARRAAHVLRAEHDAILVGAGTVLADDPLLTVRLPDPGSAVPPAATSGSRPARGKARAGGKVATRAPRSRAAASASGVVAGNAPVEARLPVRQPLRVVLDGRLRISPTARLLGSASAAAQTLVFSSAMAPRQKASALEAAGAEVIRMPGQGSRVHLTEVLQELATRGIQSVLVEGGADVHAAFISAGLVDGVAVFQAPLLLGGGVPIARGQGRGVASALRLGPLEVQRFGDDLCVRADVLR